MNVVTWILRIVSAVILLQTLFFKFGGAEESIAIFSQLSEQALGDPKHEAMLRIGTGVMELIAALLILTPKISHWGALLSVGLMLGAIMSHVLFLGYDSLFALAVVVFVSSLILVWFSRTKFLALLKK